VSVLASVMAVAAFAEDGTAGPVVEATDGRAALAQPSAGATDSSQQNTSTAEIPAAEPPKPPRTAVEGDNPAPPLSPANTGSAAGGDAASDQAIEEYEAAQNPELGPAPHLHSLNEFMNQTDSSPIGLELREDRRTLNSGEQAEGLLITKVDAGSPAAEAGLRAYSTAAHSVMDGAAMAAAMLFPPAVLAVALLDQTHVGETYDMIIGVDGRRITNYLDFEEQMRDVKPGDLVYLSIVRDGKRMQVRVEVPKTASAASN
jgi:PDZ domain